MTVLGRVEFELPHAGRLVWKQIRSVVAELKWRGHDIDLFEDTSGWLFRRFVIRGEAGAVRTAHRILDGLDRNATPIVR